MPAPKRGPGRPAALNDINEEKGETEMQDSNITKIKLMPQDWEGKNIAVDSKVKGRMPKFAAMDLVVVDAPNLTSDQISELAQPISPKKCTSSKEVDEGRC